MYHYLPLAHTLTYILKDILYGLLKNNVVIKGKVDENDRMAAKTPLVILYGKLNSGIDYQ